MEATVLQDPELGEVSWKVVDEYYKNMSSQDENVRKHANKWLIAFYESPHSKKIAEELLAYGDDVNQFLGAQIIYK